MRPEPQERARAVRGDRQGSILQGLSAVVDFGLGPGCEGSRWRVLREKSDIFLIAHLKVLTSPALWSLAWKERDQAENRGGSSPRASPT